MIPTVELKQTGKGIARARGRPKGVVETRPRKRRFQLPDEPKDIRALRASEDAAIRKARAEKTVDVIEPDSPQAAPQAIFELGPKQQLTRYELPKSKPKRKTSRIGPTTKKRLKQGAAIGAAAAATLAARRLLAEDDTGILGGAVQDAGVLGRRAVRGALSRLTSGGGDDDSDDDETLFMPGSGALSGQRVPTSQVATPSPPRRPAPRTPIAKTPAILRSLERRRNRLAEIRGSPTDPRNFLSTPVETPFGETSEVLANNPAFRNQQGTGFAHLASLRGQAKQQWTTMSPAQKRRLKAAGITSFALFAMLMAQFHADKSDQYTNESLVTQTDSGLTPCEHMKQAGRMVFDMAEQGDKKGARKEL